MKPVLFFLLSTACFASEIPVNPILGDKPEQFTVPYVLGESVIAGGLTEGLVALWDSEGKRKDDFVPRILTEATVAGLDSPFLPDLWHTSNGRNEWAELLTVSFGIWFPEIKF